MDDEIESLLATTRPDIIIMGQTMSLCSLYISEALLAASSSELCCFMIARWKELHDIETEGTERDNVLFNIDNTIKWALSVSALEHSLIPGKYSPTEYGWHLGKLYMDTIIVR